MHNKINLDQNLAIFYSGGSGGFLFFYYMLLFKQHVVGYDVEVLEKFKDQISELKILQKKDVYKDCYQNIAGPDWPSYEDFKSDNFFVSDSIKQEIESLKNQFVSYRNVSACNSNYDLLLDNIDKLIQAQFRGTHKKWTQFNIIPNNNITQSLKSQKYKHKLYFYRSSNVDDWKAYKGKKIVFYTDFKTQLRMSIYKKAKWFDDDSIGQRDILVSDIKNVINNVELINGINKEVYDLIPLADYTVTLQQLINNPREIFQENINDKQIDLIKKWQQLHPDLLLNKTKLF
jgi:hypothetical protein